MPPVDLPQGDQQRLDCLQLEVEARVEWAQQRMRQALAVQPGVNESHCGKNNLQKIMQH